MSAQLSPIPRKPASADDTLSQYGALSDVQDAVRFIPASEYKTFNVVAGDYPMVMSTTLAKVDGVIGVGCWNLNAPTSAAYTGGIAWSLGKDPGDVLINGIQSLTSGTKYRVTLRIEGGR